MNFVGQNTIANGPISRRILIRGMFVAAVGLLVITIVLAWTSINASPFGGGTVEKASAAGLLLDPAVIEHFRREHADGAAAAPATGSQVDRALVEHRQREYGNANGAGSNASSGELLLNPAVVQHLQRERAT
jgi:hypothetical protein